MSRPMREVLYAHKVDESLLATFHLDSAALVSVLNEAADSDEGIHGSNGFNMALRKLSRRVSEFLESRERALTIGHEVPAVMEEVIASMLSRKQYISVECAACTQSYSPSEIDTMRGPFVVATCPQRHAIFKHGRVIR